MTDPEKLDLILTTLYEKPGKRGHLIMLLQEKGTLVTLEEAYSLGQVLGEAQYVLYKPTLDDVLLALTAEGIDFIESSSFAESGTALAGKPSDPYVFYNRLVDEEGQVTVAIDPENAPAARQLVEQIRTTVNQDETVNYETRQSVFECSQAVEYGIDSGVPFNGYNLLTLLEITFNIESVAGLAQRLLVLFS